MEFVGIALSKFKHITIFAPMKHSVFYCLFIASFFLCQKVQAQTDLGSWTGVKLATKLDKQTSLSVNPIWRMREQLSTLNTTFIDVDLKRSFGDFWVMLRNRSLLDRNTKYNHWIFADIGQKGSFTEKILWEHKLRYHWGLKINDFDDVDLLRYEPAIKFIHSKKFNTKLGFDAHYRVIENPKYFRTRYHIGGKYAFSKPLALELYYWFDDFTESADTHLIISTLSYTFDLKKKEEVAN